jgi:hypothetical protein
MFYKFDGKTSTNENRLHVLEFMLKNAHNLTELFFFFWVVKQILEDFLRKKSITLVDDRIGITIELIEKKCVICFA